MKIEMLSWYLDDYELKYEDEQELVSFIEERVRKKKEANITVKYIRGKKGDNSTHEDYLRIEEWEIVYYIEEEVESKIWMIEISSVSGPYKVKSGDIIYVRDESLQSMIWTIVGETNFVFENHFKIPLEDAFDEIVAEAMGESDYSIDVDRKTFEEILSIVVQEKNGKGDYAIITIHDEGVYYMYYVDKSKTLPEKILEKIEYIPGSYVLPSHEVEEILEKARTVEDVLTALEKILPI